MLEMISLVPSNVAGLRFKTIMRENREEKEIDAKFRTYLRRDDFDLLLLGKKNSLP